MTQANSVPREIISISVAKVINLDVRPILKAGGEPFGVIMEAIAKTPADGALKLRATFKPVPLFHVLGKQGWQHWVEGGEADDWVVWFYHADSGQASAEISRAELGAAHLQKENPELGKRLRAEGNAWYLDVRRLSPPEPMELTLSVLEKLPQDAALVQINERVPQFLLPILLERGFHYAITQLEGPEIRIEIKRR